MSDRKPPTPEEAREILVRFINSHFRQRRPDAPRARFSIPTRPDYDDDIRMADFIDHAEKQADRIRELEADLARLQGIAARAGDLCPSCLECECTQALQDAREEVDGG